MITKDQVAKAEQQIYDLRKNVRYDIRELTIEMIVNKYAKGLDYEEDNNFQDKLRFRNVFFIPEYQRNLDFIWNTVRQSRFIESVILGLPIPLIIVAENKHGGWEIVDGSQRIRALYSFVKNELQLEGLEELNSLNGFKYEDLDVSRQHKLIDSSLKIMVLSEDADDELKKGIFERINFENVIFKPTMQMRKNTFSDGIFTKFIYDLCNDKEEQKINETWKKASILLKELTPMDFWLENRDERQELVLRFFALSDNVGNFPKKDVQKFLDDFLNEKNTSLKSLDENAKNLYLADYYQRFLRVLQFVKNSSEYGFRENKRKQTKRVIFEALSVGVYLALNQNKNLICSKEKISDILNSPDFKKTWSGNPQVVYALDKVQQRIDFVANKLLDNDATD